MKLKISPFYKKLLATTWPILLQSLMTSSLNMLDTLMIGKVGEVELASVGIANQYYFLFSLFIFGISGGAGVLASQLWGQKDTVNIKKTLCKSLKYSVVLGLGLTSLGLVFPHRIMGIFSSNGRVIAIGSMYLSITVITYVFTAMSFTAASVLRSIGQGKLPMVASFFGLVTNALLNYCLIFGHFKMPAMGVKGAALATLVARVLEWSIIVYGIYGRPSILRIGINDFKSYPKTLSKILTKLTRPIVINEACWGLGNITYVAIYARLGTQAAAAMQICSSLMNLFMVFAFALSYASVVVIGHEVGGEHWDRVKTFSRKIGKLSLVIGLVLGLGLIGVAKPLIGIFNVSHLVKTSAIRVLYIYGALMAIRMVNMVFIVGIFRGGGDARYWSIVQGLTLWCLGVPAALVAAFMIKLPLHGVVVCIALEEGVKLLIVMKRYGSYKWIHKLLKHHDSCELVLETCVEVVG